MRDPAEAGKSLPRRQAGAEALPFDSSPKANRSGYPQDRIHPQAYACGLYAKADKWLQGFIATPSYQKIEKITNYELKKACKAVSPGG